MPNYVASSPSVAPAPRPVVDVGDIINAASDAFQANKRGIMTRAVLQMKAQQEQQAQDRQDQQQQLEQQRFELTQRQQHNQEQSQLADYLQKGYSDVTGQVPVGSPGTSPSRVTIAGRELTFDPNNTPAARQDAERLKQLSAYNAGLKDGDPQKRTPEDLQLIAHNEPLYTEYVKRHTGLSDPKAPVLGSPEWMQAEIAKAKIEKQYGYHAPPASGVQFLVSQDAHGNPVYAVGDKNSKTITQTETPARAGGAASGGALADVSRARLAAAGQQIANADDAMTAFEEQVKQGHQTLSGPTLELARKAMTNDLGSAVAYQLLASENPAVAKYVRSAKEAATAERMVTPRGGSNTLMSAEQALMSAGAGGDSTLIEQARAYRKTLRHALNTESGAPASTPKSGPSAHVSHAQQLWDNAVKLHGKDAVIQEVGERPTE